jgi:hypothetical protein
LRLRAYPLMLAGIGDQGLRVVLHNGDHRATVAISRA